MIFLLSSHNGHRLLLCGQFMTRCAPSRAFWEVVAERLAKVNGLDCRLHGLGTTEAPSKGFWVRQVVVPHA